MSFLAAFQQPQGQFGERDRNRGSFQDRLMSPMTQIGLSMLANSGPSLTPKSPFAGMAQGMNNAMQYQQMRDKREQSEADRNLTIRALMQRNPGMTEEEAGAIVASGAAGSYFAASQGGNMTDDIEEFLFAQSQGYDGNFVDFQQAIKGAGNPGQFGSIPPGHRLAQDDQGAYYYEVIPGSPAAREAEVAEAVAEAGAAQRDQYGNVVLDDINRVQEKVEDSTGWSPTTGFFGAIASNIAGTEAFDVKELTGTIRANIGFDRLQAMREASPTGGALGNVTERELARLEAVLGSLEQAQSREQFLYNLSRLEGIYEGVLEKAGSYPNAAEFGFGGSIRPANDPLGIL